MRLGIFVCLVMVFAAGAAWATGTVTVTEFPVSTNGPYQYSPTIRGNTVVWGDERGAYRNLYVHNLVTDTEIPLFTLCRRTGRPSHKRKRKHGCLGRLPQRLREHLRL